MPEYHTADPAASSNDAIGAQRQSSQQAIPGCTALREYNNQRHHSRRNQVQQLAVTLQSLASLQHLCTGRVVDVEAGDFKLQLAAASLFETIRKPQGFLLRKILGSGVEYKELGRRKRDRFP